MPNSVYRVTEVIGTSTRSWEDAAKNAVNTAGRTIRDLRVAQVGELDMTIENGKVQAFRAKVKLSFKYEPAPAPTAAKKKVVKKKAKKRR